MTKGKETWDSYATDDAYFAVLSEDRFRKENFDAAARDEFFRSGREHISTVWDKLQRGFGVDLQPDTGLDFGCGVGRLLIPLAKRCRSAVGVDISERMLAEARRNASADGTENLKLQTGDEFSDANDHRYDFVHTYIVLQHIDPQTGCVIVAKMLERLEPGGFGMIHLTYKNTNRSFSRLRADIYRDYPIVHRTLNAVRGRSEPIMPMYEYDLERVYDIFDTHRCIDRFERATDHSGILGRMIFFRKN